MIKVVLSSVIDIISGGTPQTSVKEYWENGSIGWLSVTDFNIDVRYVYDSEKKITEKGLKESNTKLLQFGDIIISARGTVGALAQIGKPMCFNQSCFGIRGKKNKIETDFLYYALKNYVQHIKKRSQGSVFDTINLKSFDLMELEIPSSINIQQKIAKVLSDLDGKIELNNKINAELEAMAKTLYDYWFVQFDFPDENGKPYKSSGGKMVWNAELKREIPEGWEVKSIGDYCKSTGGFAFKSSWWSDKGLKVVKIKNIQEDNTISLNDLSYADILSDKIGVNFLAKPGNVLVAMTGATVGKFAIVPFTNEPLFVNQRVGYFNLGENPIDKLPFLINSLNQKYFREAIFTLASGAAQPNISNEQINNIPLILPKIELILNFNSSLSSSYSKILNNQKENQELASLRDWLLPMLMNGQVTVGGYDVEDRELGMVAEEKVEYKK
jgi:type I restriction enzyme S subunit